MSEKTPVDNTLSPIQRLIGVEPSYLLDNLEEHYAKANEFYKKIGSPKTVCAPMVNQSELPFRMLVRKYGIDLCYTPMINASIFMRNPKRTAELFQSCETDRPLFAQFAGDDAELILKGAKHIQSQVDAIDINLGCPQQIARRGHYGSFLLEETKLIQKIVRTLHDNLDVPVTVKIRILNNDPTGEKTLALGRALQDSGASVLTLHGRTREMIKQRIGPCDFEMIRRMKETLSIPVFANGGIHTIDDVTNTFKHTNVDAVMSSEALLTWPTMFGFKHHDEEADPVAVTYEMLDYFDQYPGWGACIRPHIFKTLFQELGVHTDIRQLLGAPKLGKDLRPVLRLIQRKQLALWDKYQSNPEAFDWEGELKAADIVGIQEAKAKEEKDRLLAEQMVKLGTDTVPADPNAPKIVQGVAGPVIETKKGFITESGFVVKKPKHSPPLEIVDDGAEIVIPAEARPFLKKFYGQVKPWYTRHMDGANEDAEEEKQCSSGAEKKARND